MCVCVYICIYICVCVGLTRGLYKKIVYITTTNTHWGAKVPESTATPCTKNSYVYLV